MREDAELRWSMLGGGEPGRTVLIESAISLKQHIAAFPWPVLNGAGEQGTQKPSRI